MQALWLAFDEIAGKGIDIFFILKFLGYLALTLTPMALPIGILLSSIMTLGNLSENYEFAAMKSAGISLKRLIRPLVIMAILLSGLNFIFLNNIYPCATLKQKNLYLNIKKKKPALAMVPGIFNTEIPGYSLKFDEKYGEENNLLKNVQIADLSRKKGKNKVITAEKGIISTEEGSKYMTLTLENGNYYEEHIKRVLLSKDRARMPASNATFDTYILNIDISSFDDEGKLDSLDVKEHHGMLSVFQLDSISKEKKITYDEYLERNSRRILNAAKAQNLHQYHDSLRNDSLSTEILDNFSLKNKSRVLQNSLQKITSDLKSNKNQNKKFKDYRKLLNLYDFDIRFSFKINSYLP